MKISSHVLFQNDPRGKRKNQNTKRLAEVPKIAARWPAGTNFQKLGTILRISQKKSTQISQNWCKICREINAKFAKNALELKSKLAENHQQTGLREHFQAKKVGTPYCHQRLTYWDKRVEQVWRVITAIPDLYSIILYGVWYNILTYFFICVCLENWKSTGKSLGQSCLGLPIRPLVFMEHLRLHSTQPLLPCIRKDRRSCGKDYSRPRWFQYPLLR